MSLHKGHYGLKTSFLSNGMHVQANIIKVIIKKKEEEGSTQITFGIHKIYFESNFLTLLNN